MTNWKESWIAKKIPKRSEIAVQYCNDTDKGSDVIAILTRDILTKDFTLFKVEHTEKKITSLGKSKTPEKLEKAHLKILKDKIGYEVV